MSYENNLSLSLSQHALSRSCLPFSFSARKVNSKTRAAHRLNLYNSPSPLSAPSLPYS